MYNLHNIKKLAEKKNHSIRVISAAAGVSDTGLHKSITRNIIKLETLDKIAEFMGVSISELISDSRFSGNKDSGIDQEQVGVYKQLIETQAALIKKHENENRDLRKEVEQLKNAALHRLSTETAYVPKV